MIQLVDIVQHYGVRPVLDGIDLEVRQGELVSLLGPNGSGKSTLLGVMAGVLSPQRGTVEIDGLRRRGTPEDELAIRRKTVYLPDQPWLPKDMTGREFLLAVGKLYEIDAERLFDHVGRLLQLFDLKEQGDWSIRGYSAGQKKKIALCSALVTDTSVFLLDEPFSGGLDPSGILALKKVLTRLAHEREATVVMSTPVPELVEELSDRIAIIHEGRIAAFDTPEGLRRLANCSGSLAEVFERLVHPENLDNIAAYFEPPKEATT